MFARNKLDPSNFLADGPAQSADHAIRSTQRVANDALDSLAVSVEDLRHQVAPLLNRANERAIRLARRGVDAVRGGSQHLRERALRASDSTVGYIRDEPVKSVLMAAAAGAALVALATLVTRSNDRG